MNIKASLPRTQRWLRFIMGGVVNTAITYGIYLGLNLVLGYQWAYFIAYILGIVFAYWFNASVVFQAPLTWRGLAAYPLVYVIQYGIAALMLGALVELVHIPETLAPLVVTVVTMPLTYLMSKLIIKLTHAPEFLSERHINNGIKQFNAQVPASQNDSDLMKSARKNRVWLALIAPVIVIVLAIWLPFGFALTGLIEEWGVLGLFNTYGLFFIADTGSPLAAHALRPLTVFPHAMAYFLDPNSFYYWHILLILALMVKGSASSYIIWKATGSLGWAMVMGVLILVYPADTMQLSFRGLHINWAIALLLLASSIFIIAYELKRPIISYSLGIVAAVLLFVANAMYEAVLALIPLPLLIPFVKDGFRAFFRLFQARIGLVVVWISGAGLYIIYVILIAPKVASYQSSISAGNTIATLTAALPKLFSIGMLRSLLGGWFDAVRMVSTEFNSYMYLGAIMTVLGGLALFIARSCGHLNMQVPSNIPSVGLLSFRLTITGLLLLLLGYAPFLLSPAHLHISQRTFLCATPGAAMVWVALLIMISRSTKALAGLATFALIFFGLGAQLFQFHHYVQISERQRTLLRGIVENFDGNLGDKTLVLLDESNQINHTWMFPIGDLRGALSYLYGRPVNSIEVCHMPSKEWQHLDALGRKGACVEGENDWVFRYPEAVTGPGYVPALVAEDLRVAKSQIITIRINPDGSTSPNPALDNHRRSLLDGKSTVALRYRGVLAESPYLFSLTIFEDQKAQDRYRWSFGDWWSLELPTRGAGWRQAEWKVNSFYHQASAWKTQQKSMLYFDFLPTKKHYILHGKFDLIINDPIRQSMQIRLNQKDQSFRWISKGEFEAEIQPGALLPGVNEVEFNSAVDPSYYGLSAKLDWFEVHPKQ